MDKMKMAQLIMKAQEIREASYISKSNSYGMQCSTAAVRAAAELGIEPVWGNLIANTLHTYWNDLGWWAEAVVKGEL